MSTARRRSASCQLQQLAGLSCAPNSEEKIRAVARRTCLLQLKMGIARQRAPVPSSLAAPDKPDYNGLEEGVYPRNRMMILRRDRTYWRNLMLFTAGCLLVGLLVVLVLFSYRSAYMYTHPVRRERPPGETPSRLGIAYQDVVLQTADGLQLAAWYTPSENGALILVAHGYGEYRMPEIYALFARHGYGVLAWDFRAHGESQGDLSSLGYYETLDFEAALDFALDQPGVRHVGAWGGSMGAATLVRAAARQPQIAAVVLDSAFPAIEEELAQVVRLAIARPLIRWFAEWQTGLSMDRLRPVDEIGMISPRPVLIIQGLADTMIPSDSAARLYAAAGEPRMLWLEPEIGHMAMLGALPQAYERRVIEFFDAVFVGR